MASDLQQLIKDHIPILWLHPDESYLPVDCKVMAEKGDLYKKEKKPDLLR